jgi:hypothetical protein
MKSDTGRLSDDQREWINHFESQGWATDVCRSAEEARQCLCNYFCLSPNDVPALG